MQVMAGIQVQVTVRVTRTQAVPNQAPPAVALAVPVIHAVPVVPAHAAPLAAAPAVAPAPASDDGVQPMDCSED